MGQVCGAVGAMLWGCPIVGGTMMGRTKVGHGAVYSMAWGACLSVRLW